MNFYPGYPFFFYKKDINSNKLQLIIRVMPFLSNTSNVQKRSQNMKFVININIINICK